MLPGSSINTEETIVSENTRAFEIDFDNKKIGGIIDGKKALMQAVRLALITQRYKYPVFSHSYGTNYKDAFEDGYIKAIGKIKNAICDSLLCDSRISGINDFEFERMGTKIAVKFRVVSCYGDILYETEVG